VEAKDYAQQAYDYTVITGDVFQRTNIINELAAVSLLSGDTADAKRRFQASYAIQQDLGDHRSMADTLTSLGRIALREGDNAEARRSYEQARTIHHDRGDHVGLAAALEGMGNSALAIGHYGEAQRYLREALQLSSQHMAPRTLAIFVGIGELFLQTGKRARGIGLLALALHHPASDQETKDRAQQLLSRYRATTEVGQDTLAKEDFESVTNALLDELLTIEERPLTHHTPHAGETLLEPLSEREMEVLTLIVDGLSNQEIAAKLHLTVATVKWYLTHIYSKLGVQNRTLAVQRARQLHILP
jgi:ATP/maltotriose-dependent transcriptional regulator MalT